ncbi:hypothetical protein CENSYa_0983 [Cenarchaeum symbiosum A]|uniref:Uncharacterized protein n=1 Tax=Cenarchaeum symbiosum (strain A) TaxID=414004 RepID=A0RW98_CENSY|nr:hypothetical protein CENSYa_0983 [Cenarchaeum symbiosum A]
MFSKTYAITGTGLAAVLALLAFTPATAQYMGVQEVGSGVQMFGMAELVHRDGDGEILGSSSVHNQLVDGGEELILNTIFNTTLGGDARAVPLDNRIDTICISTTDGSQIGTEAGDPLDRDSFESPARPSGAAACLQDTDGVTAAGDGLAIIGPITYTAGTDFNAGEQISTILVCAEVQGNTNYGECSFLGPLFAAVDVTDVTPTGTDTVDVTYTFNLTTPIT